MHTARMPFKRVLLGSFALQRLVVWIAVSISFYYPPVEAPLMSTFQAHSPGLFIVSIITFLTLLGVLYFLRRKCISKWLALLIFCTTEAATWIGFDVLVHTDVRVFNCSFTLVWAISILSFDAIRSKKQSKIVDTTTISVEGITSNGAWIGPVHEPDTLSRINGVGNYEFLKIHIDGSVAFVLVSAVSVVLYVEVGFLPAMDYGMSLLFQFVLIMWFVFDFRRLDRILGSDEATQGVIYVYIDAALATGYVTMIAAAIGAMVVFIAGFAMSGPVANSLRCAGCSGCGGWANCCECNCEGCRALFSDSKCLFFNDEGSSFDCCESAVDEMPTIADLRKRRSNLDEGMERV